MNGASEQQWQERITIDEAVLAGKPVIRGTRIAVEQVLDSLVSTVDARLTPHPKRVFVPSNSRQDLTGRLR